MNEPPAIRPAPQHAEAATEPAPGSEQDATTRRPGSRPLASVRPGARSRGRELHGLLAAGEPIRGSAPRGGARPGGRARSSTTSPTRRPTMRCSRSCRGSIASSAAADSRPGPTSSRFTPRASRFAVTRGAIATWPPTRARASSSSPTGGRPRRGRRRRASCSHGSSRRSRCLTAHQRDVLLALAVDGVPIDVLADRLSTNRNALYKTLHDARTRLRGLLDDEETTHDTSDTTARGCAARARRARDRLRRMLRAARRLRRAGDRRRRRRGRDPRHARASRRLPRVQRGARVAPRARRDRRRTATMRRPAPARSDVVVVGGGVAAGACVTTLREAGYDGTITVAAPSRTRRTRGRASPSRCCAARSRPPPRSGEPASGTASRAWSC